MLVGVIFFFIVIIGTSVLPKPPLGPGGLGRGQLRGGAWAGLRNTDPTSVPVGTGAVQRGAGAGCGWRPIPAAGSVGPLPQTGREAPGWEGASGIPLPVQRSPAAASIGPAPPRAIGRIPASSRQGPRSGSAVTRERGPLTCAAASLRAPCSALHKLRPGPLPQPRTGGGAGDRARPIKSGLL